jgi:hypothetical protein
MKKSSSPVLSRRTVFAGAGAAGALAAAASLLPDARDVSPVSQAGAKPEQSSGYRLSEHVKRYYASART